MALTPRSAFPRELKQLREEVKTRNPHAKWKMIERAFVLGEQAHASQKRKSGEPYFTHPIAAAITLAQNEADEETIAAALLHDVLEDTPLTGKDVSRKFGRTVYTLVKGVTKLKRLTSLRREHQEALDLRKTILASTKDVRVLAIKLADKLHNIETLEFMPRTRQRQIARDALEVYAPLAFLLGMGDISTRMKDACFKILQPEEYIESVSRIETLRAENTPLIRKKMTLLRRRLKHIRGVELVTGEKGVYELYSKMRRKPGAWDQIYDAIYLKIIVRDVMDCYRVLGEVHHLFSPLHQKLKDFIAIPRQNAYRAIHTTIIGRKGRRPLKIYITTREMDRQNQCGVLATLKYNPKQFTTFHGNLLDQLSSLSAFDADESQEELMQAVHFDLLEDRVIVFSPKGDAFELPENSTILDYAYMVLPGSADKSWKARLNGKLVGLDSYLRTGDLVEIVFSKQPQVRKNWLSGAQTLRAKNRIHKALARIKHHTRRKARKNVEVIVSAKDRAGLVKDITKMVSIHNLELKGLVASADGHNKSISYLSFGPSNMRGVKSLVQDLYKIQDVSSVTIRNH